MKKINFLKTLKRKGKLELVESSNEINQSYLEKSESNLSSAKIHLFLLALLIQKGSL